MLNKRLIEIVDTVTDAAKRWREMEDVTGIPRKRWQNVSRGVQRATEEMIEAIGEHWPQYAYWLVTGRSDIANGHRSPIQDRIELELARLHAMAGRTRQVAVHELQG